TDGKQRNTQSQQLANDSVVVAQTFYNGRGLPEISTKPAMYGPDSPNAAPTGFGFQVGFATAPDINSTTPTTSGYLSDYYSGANGASDDAGYPYARTQYENSARERPMQIGRPGATLAIQGNNTLTTTLTYGTNDANPFAIASGVPQGEYDVIMK